MKKLFVIIFSILSLNTFAQITSSSIFDTSYLQLRKLYKAHCDSMVIDTVVEDGVIKFEVKIVGGKPELVSTDTIWDEVKCKGYYIAYYPTFDVAGSRISINTDSNASWVTLGNTVNYSYSKASKPYFETKITRNKYCEVKYKNGNEQDFWEWVDKNYLK